jgi:hypothetical protein
MVVNQTRMNYFWIVPNLQDGRFKYTALLVIRVSDDGAGPPRCAGHAGTNGNSSCSAITSPCKESRNYVIIQFPLQ